jgi:hypothetical protein
MRLVAKVLLGAVFVIVVVAIGFVGVTLDH